MVLQSKFGYKELGFSARDIGTVVVGNSGNVILDGVFFIILHLTIGFGQTKLPVTCNFVKLIRAGIEVLTTQSLILTVILDCS
jgi:hypothetical protein